MRSGDSTHSGNHSGTHSGTQPGNSPALLVDHLLASGPGSIFLIDCAVEDLYWPENQEKSHLVKRFDTLESALLDVKGEVSADAGEQIALLNIGSDVATLAQKMGTAVRAFPNRLIIYTNAQSVPDTLFFAFGFRKLDVVDSGSASAQNRWYEYRLSHYKQSPDWLNARFWANPARFKLDEASDVYFDPDDTDEEE